MILRFKRPPVDITLTSQIIFDFPIKVQFSICISEKIITFCVYSYWCMPRFSITCVQNHVWKLNFNNMKKKHTCMNLSIKRSFRHPWHSWSRRPRSGLRSRAKRAAHAPKYICPKLYTCRRPLSVFNPSVPIFRNNRRPWFSYSSLRDKVPEKEHHL